MAPAMSPQSIDRHITKARDASKLQKKKVMATGIAFCTENIMTTRRIISNKMSVAKASPPYLPIP